MNLLIFLLLLAGTELFLEGNSQDPTSDEAYPVRLVGGNAPTEGRVEVSFNGGWGTVCGAYYSFDSDAAAVVCRQLGLGGGRSLSVNNAVFFGEGVGHVLMEKVACRGNESRLTDCRFPGWGTICGHFADVGVLCQRDTFSIRLGGSLRSATEGRVEMKVRGQWAAVCADHWTASSTSVVCRELGLTGVNLSHVVDADEGAPLYLKSVRCRGDEVALADCANNGLFETGCLLVVHVSCQITDEEFLSVRLTGGLSSNQGYLELYHDGGWGGTVCTDDWDESATSVACRQLGFPGPNATLEVRASGRGLFGDVPVGRRLLLAGVRCRGDEGKIADCRLVGGSGRVLCHDYFTIGIMCQEADDRQVRLVEGPSGNQSGLVQMSFGGHWLAVSPAEGFEASLASVVCRQLGFVGAGLSVGLQALFTDRRQQVTVEGPVGVACSGGEGSVADCPFSHLGSVNVVSGIVCQAGHDHPIRLVDGATNATGRVEIFFNGIWGAICDNLWDVRSATVVCRQLGFGGQGLPLSTFVRLSVYLLLDRVQCQGSELRMDECDLPWGAVCAGDLAGVVCHQSSGEEIPVRLADGRTSSEGRVEVLVGGRWGTVCDEGWDDADASVVCRQLGFGGPVSRAVRHAAFGPGAVGSPVHMNNVTCAGDERRLVDCPFTTGRTLFFACRYGREAVGVVCQADEDIPVRLTGGASPREGRVEISFRGQWGGICNTGWDEAEADVVCRQLGFHNGTNLVVSGAYYRDDDLPSYLSALECRGNESNLADCLAPTLLERSTAFGINYCSVFVGVMCQSDDTFPVRLVNGISPRLGSVEVFFNGVWGRVCEWKWDIHDAGVVCNQLGYDGAEAPVYKSLFGAGQTYHMNGVDCVGNESRLADCPFKGWKMNVNSCRYSMGVVCKVVYGAFGATCPPSEAVPDPFDGQRPTILRYSRNGQSLLPVAWTHPMLTKASGDVVNFTTCRMADGEGAPWPCRSGDLFNATGFSSETGRKVKVEVVATDLHTNQSHICTFYILVKEAIAIPSFAIGSPVTRTGLVRPPSADVRPPDHDQCPEEATVTAIGTVRWPKIPAGSVAESHRRCPVQTEKAGHPRVTRRCSARGVGNATSGSVWEEPVTSDCGGVVQRTSLRDLKLIEVTSGNVLEVIEFLANLTSSGKWDGIFWSDERADDIAGILLDIAVAGSGQIEVTEAVVDVVSNILHILNGEHPSALVGLGGLPAIVRTLVMQVESTFHARGPFSIQREFVHVETISVNSSQAEGGFSLAVVRTRREESTTTQPLTTRSTLIGTEVVLFANQSVPPSNERVRTVITVGNNVTFPPDEGSVNVTLILYENDNLFPSAFKINSSLSLLEGVVSVAVEGAVLINSTMPVVTEFRAAADHRDSDLVVCVFWDFSLRNGTGDWSSAGCRLDRSTDGGYACRCDRSANLAALRANLRMADNPQSPDYISRISCIGSAGSYLLILTIYLSLRKLRGSRSGHMFIQFIFSLLMLYAVFLAGADRTLILQPISDPQSYQPICTAVATLLHYLPVTAMMWTAIQSRKIYVESKSTSPHTDGCCKALLQSLFAWGAPLISAIASFMFGHDRYTSSNQCIMAPGLPMYIGVLLPIALALAHNLVAAAMTVHHLRGAKRDGDATSSEPIALRLVVAVSIWMLLTISLCSGFLSVHSTAQAARFIFASANCILVFMVCCMTALHWCEDRSSPPLSDTVPPAGPENGDDNDDPGPPDTPTSSGLAQGTSGTPDGTP